MSLFAELLVVVVACLNLGALIGMLLDRLSDDDDDDDGAGRVVVDRVSDLEACGDPACSGLHWVVPCIS